MLSELIVLLHTKNRKDMKESYTIKICRATCGCENHFVFYEDKSYVKCTNCNREYFGGIEELKKLNAETFDEVKEKINKDAVSYIYQHIQKAFQENKHFKFK